MALSRVVLKNLQQRAPALCINSLLGPHFNENYIGGVGRGLGSGGAQGQGWSYGLLQRFSSSSSSGIGSKGQEVAVQSDQAGRRSRWRSLLPRRFRRPGLWRRKDNRTDNDPFEMFPSASLVNTLLEAAENMNRVFENIIPSQLIGRFKDTDESYKLRYNVPGLTKDELKITIDDGVLRIRGERKVESEEDESEDEYWMSYGYYNTSLVLPDDARQDEIKAELKDGVLTITIPKVESHGKDVKEVKIH